ncbi:MAG: ribosome assembly RNA-binding protein YhbY [Clostridia bacterium]|nr:ribosome assembly RNA-binding protein YhbY [Clostridia bacterium]
MITSKQRAFLRGKANDMDTIFQIGKGGLGDNLIKQLYDALEARELIKIRTLENCEYTPREAADEISERLGADVISVVGYRIVLYRESRTKKNYSLMIKHI